MSSKTNRLFKIAKTIEGKLERPKPQLNISNATTPSNRTQERQRDISTARPQKNAVQKMMNLAVDTHLIKLQKNLERVADKECNRRNHRSETEKKLQQSGNICTMRKLKAVNAADNEETKTPRADDNIDVEVPSARYGFNHFTDHVKKLTEKKFKNSREMIELKELKKK